MTILNATTSSIFAHIYTALIDRINTALVDPGPNEGDPPQKIIRFIEQDFGQLEAEIRPTVSFPALLIDFETAAYSDETHGVQIGELIILLRLAFNPYNRDGSLVPDAARAAALRYYTIEQRLHEILHGWSYKDAEGIDYFSPLMRISAVTEKRAEDVLRVRQLRYACAIKDDVAFKQYPLEEAPPVEITVEIED